jgi:hypothetical protein
VDDPLTWAFCPWCGHLIYQHNAQGCAHLTSTLQSCADADCKPDVLVTEGGHHAHTVPVKCDCRRTHTLLVAELQ